MYMYVYSTGKTPEEIRKTFNIKNDFTPEEEEQVSMGNTCICTCTCGSIVALCAIRMSSGTVDFKSFLEIHVATRAPYSRLLPGMVATFIW